MGDGGDSLLERVDGGAVFATRSDEDQCLEGRGRRVGVEVCVTPECSHDPPGMSGPKGHRKLEPWHAAGSTLATEFRRYRDLGLTPRANAPR